MQRIRPVFCVINQTFVKVLLGGIRPDFLVFLYPLPRADFYCLCRLAQRAAQFLNIHNAVRHLVLMSINFKLLVKTLLLASLRKLQFLLP